MQLVYQQQAIQSFKSIQPSMTVNYGGGGSGKGRTDLASNVVQFAGSDSPIPSTDLHLFNGKTVLYFPILISPITVSYNLPGIKSGLKLDAPVIADIFQAKITKWNDPKIAAQNPGVKLPSTAITIAHRSDSSGTTQNFSEFLVEGAPGVWKLGSDSTINWPANSQGGNGNSGVAQIIKQHRRGRRVRGLRRRQGLRADLRFDQEQGRQLRRAVGAVGLRSRQQRPASSPT